VKRWCKAKKMPFVARSVDDPSSCDLGGGSDISRA